MKPASTDADKTTSATAVADREVASTPQTSAEIAATEQALGITPEPVKPANTTTNGPTQAIAQRAPVRMGVAPTTVEEGWRLAQFIAASDLVPKGYKGQPADVLVAIQYGMEVGLPPMAALHSIYVTNGRPSLWGDGFLAVIMASAVYKDHDEFYLVDGQRRDFLLGPDLLKDTTTAVTTFWRRDSERPRTATFDIAKAKKAGLWSKAGPWQDYPDRMLKYRARGFAGHDAFPDVLRGIRSAEEVADLPPEPEALEPVREVRRLSEQRSECDCEASGNLNKPKQHQADPHAKNCKVYLTPTAAPAATSVATATTEVILAPTKVLNVEQFMGGFTVTLGDGTKVDLTETTDAMELEKFKGTPHLVRVICARATDGNLQLQSFGIAD